MACHFLRGCLGGKHPPGLRGTAGGQRHWNERTEEETVCRSRQQEHGAQGPVW